MHHLVNFYRTRCEQLEEQKNALIKTLSQLYEMRDGNFNFQDWLSSVTAAQAHAPRPPAPNEKLVDTPMYGQQATDMLRALSDPNHPVHKSPMMKEMMFGMLHNMGVDPAQLKSLQSQQLPTFPPTGSQPY